MSQSIPAAKLYDYTQCPHRVWRDVYGPQDEKIKETNPFVQLLWERGIAHEEAVVPQLGDFLDMPPGTYEDRFKETIKAMREKAPLIYQGVLIYENMFGIPDLLKRLPDGQYAPIDIKSGRGFEGVREEEGEAGKPKKHYAVQLALYSDLLCELGFASQHLGRVIDIRAEEVQTFTGLKGLDASTAVFLVQLEVPFGALLASIFFKDNLGWLRALGMAVAFFGVGLIAGAPSIRNQLFSVFLVVSGALTWSLGQVMIKKMTSITGFQLIAWLSFFAGPQMLISSVLIENGHLESIKNATIIGWGTVIYLGVIMTAVGYGLWYHILKKYDVNQAMPFLLLLPVSSLIGAVLFLGERPNLGTMLGGTIIIIGVAIIVFAGQRIASIEKKVPIR